MDWSVCIAESGPSLHGYDYPEHVLREAVPLFHGKPVRAHPRRIVQGKVEYQHLPEAESPMAPYLVKEMIGTLDRPWWHDGAILARLRLLPSCELSDDVLHTYGLSMQCHATVNKDAEGVPVEVVKIGAVESVDLVEHPALSGRILGPWLSQAEAERWHRAERAMVRFEESCQAMAESRQRQAILTRYEARLDAVVRRYEARMEALYAR
jgi:hypothetical protein